MNIQISVFALAKNNTGLFKSPKQAIFLISQLEKCDGCIGYLGNSSSPIFVDWDDKGITKIIKATKKVDVLMFERKIDGVLTGVEIQKIKALEKRQKALKKEIKEREDAYNNGMWNGSGDITTYTQDMIDRFNYFHQEKIEHLKSIEAQLGEFDRN
jgi:hypothetical protein